VNFLKNYTSDVPVSITIGRIEAVLIRAGVSGIGKDYGPNGKILAVHFRLDFDGKPVTVRLPANEAAAERALFERWKQNHDMTRYDNQRKKSSEFRQQAERTAWKIVQDWVEVQLSMIAMQQAEFAQVFLPYVWDGKQTMFERWKGEKYAGLLPEKT
jgi:hypothetical protein